MERFNKLRLACAMAGGDCENCYLKCGCTPCDEQELEKIYKLAKAQKEQNNELWVFIEYGGAWMYHGTVRADNHEEIGRLTQLYATGEDGAPIKFI